MVTVHADQCALCGGCVGLCPEDALHLVFGDLQLEPAKCTECNLCVALCPVDAIDPEVPFTRRTNTDFHPS